MEGSSSILGQRGKEIRGKRERSTGRKEKKREQGGEVWPGLGARRNAPWLFPGERENREKIREAREEEVVAWEVEGEGAGSGGLGKKQRRSPACSGMVAALVGWMTGSRGGRLVGRGN